MKKLLLLFSCALFAGQAIAQNTVTVCWDKVACGYLTSAAIRTDGTLWTWGYNTKGEAGNGTTTPVAAPQQIGTDDDWVEIVICKETFFGLKSNGTLWGWGLNTDGQIGDGTTVNRTTPVQIGSDTDWKMVSSGWGHTFALKTNGTLWGWGVNQANILGDGSGPNKLVPTQIGAASDWKTVSSGNGYGLAIKNNGTLWGWGPQPGINDDYSFHQIGIDSDWKSVTGGYVSSAALRTDGTLWTWGKNYLGQLGLGYVSTDFILTPTKVNNDVWLDVKSNWHSTSALRADGTWWSWGQKPGPNDETTYIIVDVLLPTLINEDNDWITISMGEFFMMGIKDDGTLWGFGINDFERLRGDLDWDAFLTVPGQLQACVEVTAGLNNNTLATISLYPNPTSVTLTLANAENLSIEKLTVTDLTGKTVLIQNSNASQIDVQQLPAGMYFLNVSASEGVQHLKFIKQ